MPLYDDDFFGQDTGNLVNKYGLQRYPNFHKYCNDVPAVILQPPALFRIYPTLDEDNQFKGYVEDGELTWLDGETGADFVGLYFPDIEFGYNNGFWLVPSDIGKYWGNKFEGMQSPREKKKFAVKNCPYSFLYANMKNSNIRDGDAPPEWCKLTDKKHWCDMIGISENSPISPPLTMPERHGIVQGRLIHNKNNMDFEDMSYEDGRSPGALHPVIMEFKKSLTKRLSSKKSKAWDKKSRANSDIEEELYVYNKVIDPKEGKNISLKSSREKNGNQSYNIHKLDFKMGYEEEIDPEEVKEEWRPFRKPREIGGVPREPLMNFTTVKEQMELFKDAFGPEVVDFCFSGTAYESVIPEDAKGAYKKFVSKCNSQKEGLWLELMKNRFKKRKEYFENKRNNNDNNNSNNEASESNESQSTVTKKAQEQAIPNMEVDEDNDEDDNSGENIAGYNEEEAAELMSQLDD